MDLQRRRQTRRRLSFRASTIIDKIRENEWGYRCVGTRMKQFTLTLLFALSSLSSLTMACGSKTSEPEQPASNEAKVLPVVHGTTPVRSPDGVPQGCPVLEDGLCYKSMEAAAKAAGKDPSTCTLAESYPAQLMCE